MVDLISESNIAAAFLHRKICQLETNYSIAVRELESLKSILTEKDNYIKYLLQEQEKREHDLKLAFEGLHCCQNTLYEEIFHKEQLQEANRKLEVELSNFRVPDVAVAGERPPGRDLTIGSSDVLSSSAVSDKDFAKAGRAELLRYIDTLRDENKRYKTSLHWLSKEICSSNCKNEVSSCAACALPERPRRVRTLSDSLEEGRALIRSGENKDSNNASNQIDLVVEELSCKLAALVNTLRGNKAMFYDLLLKRWPGVCGPSELPISAVLETPAPNLQMPFLLQDSCSAFESITSFPSESDNGDDENHRIQHFCPDSSHVGRLQNPTEHTRSVAHSSKPDLLPCVNVPLPEDDAVLPASGPAKVSQNASVLTSTSHTTDVLVHNGGFVSVPASKSFVGLSRPSSLSSLLPSVNANIERFALPTYISIEKLSKSHGEQSMWNKMRAPLVRRHSDRPFVLKHTSHKVKSDISALKSLLTTDHHVGQAPDSAWSSTEPTLDLCSPGLCQSSTGGQLTCNEP